MKSKTIKIIITIVAAIADIILPSKGKKNKGGNKS